MPSVTRARSELPTMWLGCRSEHSLSPWTETVSFPGPRMPVCLIALFARLARTVLPAAGRGLLPHPQIHKTDVALRERGSRLPDDSSGALLNLRRRRGRELARLRQLHSDHETRMRVSGDDLPSVQRDGALRDGESETHAASRAAPVVIDSIERLEDRRE